ncbi:MAG: hypothetical protein KDI09_08070 [Halioglobus sp.]|nr:hypothetical protein [Halioglobus sp.]
MLHALQKQLTDLYQVDTAYQIDDFLITDPGLAKRLGANVMLADTDETVLLSEDDDGMSLSVFLDEDLLQRLAERDPLRRLRAGHLSDLWTVIEGVSHFICLVFRAQRETAVTLLELEMQAEVDKFVGTWLLAVQQDDTELAERLHGWLFDDVRFHPDLSRDQHERYRAANDYAGRFCHGLQKRLQDGTSVGVSELRHFYRLTQTDKISHIHSRAWSAS